MKNKEKNFISAVVYVNNNEKDIRSFLENINKTLSENFLKYEIICVNDASTDGTVSEIKKVSEDIAKSDSNASITIINMSYYQGKELSMNAGVDIAIGDFVYEFDSIIMDYDINLIMQVYNKSLEGYDIVNATSNNKRRKTSTIFYKLFNKYSNNQYKIDTETFRIISRRGINRIQSINKTIPYRKAIYANCGLKLTSIQYKTETAGSKSTWGGKLAHKEKKERERNAIDALILFTDISYKFSIIMTAIMMLLTIAIAIYAVYIFISSTPIEGWTTTMLFLSFGFFGIFAVFAIVIKYLSIIVNLIFKKSKYIVESIDKII